MMATCARPCSPRRGLLPSICAAWALLGLLSIGLSAVAPRGVLADPALPAGICVALVCTELAALAVAAVVLGLLLTLLRRWRPGRYIAMTAIIFLYAASWASFWLSGQFLDPDGLEFFTTNFVALSQYVVGSHPLLLALMPLVVLLIAVALVDGVPRWIGRFGPVARRRLTRVTVTVAVVAAGISILPRASASGRIHDPASGAQLTEGELFRHRRAFRAGPVTRLLATLAPDSGGPPPAPDGVEPFRVVRNPVISIDEYAESVDPAALRRRNVVIVTVDSLRADRLGGRRDVMPALEALARESRVFTDCVAQASHTDYASPAILSSQYPLRGERIHRYPERPPYPRTFIYDVLKAVGYRTALFSSQNEDWGGMSNYLRTGSLDRFQDAGNAGRDPESTVDDGVTVAEAIRWLDGISNGPFFLHLNLQNAHSPYVVPPGFPRPFGPDEVDFHRSFGHYPRGKLDVVRDLYDDSLAYVDSLLESLLRRLPPSTIFVVTADHGEAFFEHGFAAHGSALYDEVARVPLVIHAPGLEPAYDPAPAQSIDVPPTLLHLLGLPPHPAFQGRNLLDSNPPDDPSRFLVAHTPAARQVAVVAGGHKLIYDARLRRYLLYDLVGDPAERVDLSAERPGVLADLAARLGTWYGEQLAYYGDPTRQAREFPPRLLNR